MEYNTTMKKKVKDNDVREFKFSLYFIFSHQNYYSNIFRT